ncbi:hypothetical protein PoB_004925600 [Plakobranchus ocellatus]|uniref:Uncharacterized protein n=1 Tax=Plakobranchus ocellatus TaxID=259542 RepID=A0AAV4BHD2_9GAST|nr:hypothetical protein PoB_004925600 [Plakobranchus ocellatus]
MYLSLADSVSLGKAFVDWPVVSGLAHKGKSMSGVDYAISGQTLLDWTGAAPGQPGLIWPENERSLRIAANNITTQTCQFNIGLVFDS